MTALSTLARQERKTRRYPPNLTSHLFPHAAESARISIGENMLMIIVGATAGGLLILMAVVIIVITCHHKRKNKRLEKELTKKKYASVLFNYDKIS